MFIVLVRQIIIFFAATTLVHISIALPAFALEEAVETNLLLQLQKGSSDSIPFNDSSVQTLKKVVNRSQCLGANDAKYFTTQNSITRNEFAFLFSKCFRYLRDKYPDRAIAKTNISHLEVSRRLGTYVMYLRKDLEKVESKFHKELVLLDRDLFDSDVSLEKAIAIAAKQLSDLRKNGDNFKKYTVGKDLESLFYYVEKYLVERDQRFLKGTGNNLYLDQGVSNSGLTRLQFARILHICLDRINQIITEQPSNIPFNKSDYIVLQTLNYDYAYELMILKQDCGFSEFWIYFLGIMCAASP
jgi:hypothetical protein